MGSAGARKAKESDFPMIASRGKRSNAARLDLTWRADQLNDTDVWRQRTVLGARRERQ